MDVVTLIALLGGIVGLVGGICGLGSLVYTIKQTRLLKQQVHADLSKDASYAEWAKKHDQAVDALARICTGTVNTGRAVQAGLPVIFPDKYFRENINRHLGRAKFFGGFEPARLSKEQLLNPVVQQLIQEVLDTVDKFKKDHTDWARALKLLPPK